MNIAHPAAEAQHWIIGECWLYCEREQVPVMWFGSAQWLSVHASIYACAPCIRRMHAKLRAALTNKDHAGRQDPRGGAK